MEQSIEGTDNKDSPQLQQIPRPKSPAASPHFPQSCSFNEGNTSNKNSLKSSTKISNSDTPLIHEAEKVDLYDPFATESCFLADPFKYKRKTTSESNSLDTENLPLSQFHDYSSKSMSCQSSKKGLFDNDMFEPIYNPLATNYADDEYIDPIVAVNSMFNDSPNMTDKIITENNPPKNIKNLPIPQMKNPPIISYTKEDKNKKNRRRSSSLDSRSIEGRAFREITPDGQTHIHLELNNTQASPNIGRKNVATLGRFKITRRVSQPRIADKFLESDFNPEHICSVDRNYTITQS